MKYELQIGSVLDKDGKSKFIFIKDSFVVSLEKFLLNIKFKDVICVNFEVVELRKNNFDDWNFIFKLSNGKFYMFKAHENYYSGIRWDLASCYEVEKIEVVSHTWKIKDVVKE